MLFAMFDAIHKLFMVKQVMVYECGSTIMSMYKKYIYIQYTYIYILIMYVLPSMYVHMPRTSISNSRDLRFPLMFCDCRISHFALTWSCVTMGCHETYRAIPKTRLLN